MKSITLSKFIYFLSKLFFYVCLALVIFIIIFSALSFLESNWNINIPFVELSLTDDGATYSRVQIPFTGMHVGFVNSYIVIFMWLAFAFYTLYFFSLSQFFKVFTQSHIFTKISIKKLRYFGWLNVIPIAFAAIVTVIDLIRDKGFKMDSEYLLVFIHLFVALLVYFYLDLVKKGKQVQDENDLTI